MLMIEQRREASWESCGSINLAGYGIKITCCGKGLKGMSGSEVKAKYHYPSTLTLDGDTVRSFGRVIRTGTRAVSEQGV